MWGKRLLACGLAVVGGGVFAGPAGAWTISGSASSVTAAATDRPVELTLSDSSTGVRLTEENAQAIEGALPSSCTQISASVADCALATGGAVTLRGGAGADRLTSDSGRPGVTLDGSGGDDVLSAGTAGTVLLGGDGADVLYGGPGNDQLDGGTGNDQLYGADGDDTLTGDDGNDQLFGGAGSDTAQGGAGTDLIDGGDGQDTLAGGDDADTLIGAAGDDALDGGNGDDTLDGGAGDDMLTGGAGRDQLSGEDGRDRLDGGADNDALDGGTGDDTLLGGDGADQLMGAEGNDSLDGGTGDDVLDGGLGNDALQGGDGNDQLDGRDGADTLAGGAGSDTVSYTDDSAPVQVSLDGTADDGQAGEGDNVQPDIEQVLGGSGPDTLRAGANPAVLRGEGGDDQLFGGAGADTLDGGAGNDTLDGGGGPDSLTGGDGLDTVDYSARTAPVTVALGAPQTPAGEAGEGDLIDATIENAIGGSGNDTLSASSPTANTLTGGPGNDTISVADQAAGDTANCGDGTDSAQIDTGDTATADCESLGSDGQPVKPLAAPKVLVTTNRLRMDRRGRIDVPMQCDLSANGFCLVKVDLRLVIGGRHISAAGHLQLAPGSEQRVRLHVKPRALRLVRRHAGVHQAHLNLLATDIAGRAANATQKITVNLGRRR